MFFSYRLGSGWRACAAPQPSRWTAWASYDAKNSQLSLHCLSKPQARLSALPPARRSPRGQMRMDSGPMTNSHHYSAWLWVGTLLGHHLAFITHGAMPVIACIPHPRALRLVTFPGAHREWRYPMSAWLQSLSHSLPFPPPSLHHLPPWTIV